MNPVANIIFDFGNVIIDLDIDGAFERIGKLRNSAIDKQAYHNKFIALAEQFEVGEITRSAFIDGALGIAADGTQATDIVDAWNSMLVGIPAYRLSMLESLKAHFNVLMLSNTNQIHIEWAHTHLKSIHGVDNFETRFFHDVYYSHEINARKPEEESFQHVIRQSYLTPEKTLFIDDIQENLEAAARLGIQTMLSPPEEEIAETLKILGFY